jgi:L-asparaginase II
MFMPTFPAHTPLAVATRGDTIESIHFGSVAVVDADGRLRFSCGDPATTTFTRSTLKPLQALPFVRDGGVERFGFEQPHVALLCASHSGEPRHVAAVAEMLKRAGNTTDDLACGTHAPTFYETRGELPPPPPYSPLAHNCSGKHAGMLACCALHGWSRRDYIGFDHPLQGQIRTAVADFTGVPVEMLQPGVDGCSAPNYALPIAALARAFARLATSEGDHPRYGRAPARLRDAMVAHPEMVSGEGRLAPEDRGRGGAGDRHPQPRARHRRQDRRRQQARLVPRGRGCPGPARAARRRPPQAPRRAGRTDDPQLPGDADGPRQPCACAGQPPYGARWLAIIRPGPQL